MRCHSVLFGLLLAAPLIVPAGTQAGESAPAGKAAAQSPDEQAIRRTEAAFRDAVAKRDLDVIASFWTPDADYVDQSGRAFKIHAGLAKAKNLAQEERTLAHLVPKAEAAALRFVTPDVAIEDGAFDRSGAEPGQMPHGRYTKVWVKKDGKWLIDGVRETPVRLDATANPLKGLAWIVGDWVAEGPQGFAEVKCTWGAGRTYILSQLKMVSREGNRISATQLIGWDPNQQRVHSYLFDSLGGSSEGEWTHEGDSWVVRTTSTLADGSRATSTKIYSRVDDNNATWESIDDEVDGQVGRDIRMKMARKPAEKDKADNDK